MGSFVYFLRNGYSFVVHLMVLHIFDGTLGSSVIYLKVWCIFYETLDIFVVCLKVRDLFYQNFDGFIINPKFGVFLQNA